jgi:hypothetical protein
MCSAARCVQRSVSFSCPLIISFVFQVMDEKIRARLFPDNRKESMPTYLCITDMVFASGDPKKNSPRVVRLQQEELEGLPLPLAPPGIRKRTKSLRTDHIRRFVPFVFTTPLQLPHLTLNTSQRPLETLRNRKWTERFSMSALTLCFLLHSVRRTTGPNTLGFMRTSSIVVSSPSRRRTMITATSF